MSNLSDPLPEDVQFLTTAQAKRFLRRATREKASFALHCHADAHCGGGMVFRDACSTYVVLSRPEARRVLSEMLSPTIEGKGGRIRVTRSRGYQSPGKGPTYWIG